MLVQQDFDLNSVHIYTDSLKDVLKKTMLNQEIIFRKQVWVEHNHTINLIITVCNALLCIRIIFLLLFTSQWQYKSFKFLVWNHTLSSLSPYTIASFNVLVCKTHAWNKHVFVFAIKLTMFFQ